jgi:hypothetical protein
MPGTHARTTLLALIFILLIVTTAAAEVDSPLLPPSPQVLGRGGSAVATASGYEALFANPAGFAAPKGESSLTFYTTSFWLYGDPLRAFLALVDPGSTALQDYVDDQLEAGGFGFGNADAVAFVGRGFGLAGLITIDAFAIGSPAATADGSLVVTLAFIGGYAFPVRIKEAVVKFGIDFRPMIRILAPMNYTIMSDFVSAFQSTANPLATLNSENALHGRALGVDLGVIVEWEGIKWGLAFRDFLGTRFRYTQDPFGDIVVSLRENGSFPSGGPSVGGYLVPMDVGTGFAYDFDFRPNRKITDLVLYWALDDIVTVIVEERPASAVLHAGGELELFDRWQLRAGFNQGYLTFGTGIQFWILDFNMAFFTRETGDQTGSRANRGLAVELAFRQRPPGQRRADRIKREDEEEQAADEASEQPAASDQN